MASKRLSPTASLLRNSRLFSLPPPLPRPSHDFTATSNFDSDTATLPYPSHASIETTQSSLLRGDWGLKRPLPQKSTANTSTPSIRIDDIDSIDHIADFESAADHSLTLKKWQEIGLPISMPVIQRGAYVSNTSLNTRSTPPTSVFENTYDNTEKSDHQGNARRWKFKGPWLAGKTEGEFDLYLERHIKQRKLEFRTFVRDRLVKERRLEQRRKAQESGDDFDGSVEVTDNDIDLYLKQLRQDEVRLYMLVEDFLDLPISVDSNPSEGTFVAMMDSDQGPPKTHLSAGLSYLRTASHMTNHPVLGPMEEEPPVQARILRPQSTNVVIKHYCALLGVGGIAANDSTMRTAFKSNGRGGKPGIQRFDAESEGGAKLWVLPDRASIDAHGRLKLHTLRVSQADEAIYQNVVPEPVGNQVPFYPTSSPMPRLDSFGKTRTGNSPAYGLSVDDSGQIPRTTSPPLDVPKNMDDSVKSLLDLLGPKQDN
ncbi:MAG: hypothetical protein LQ337_004291 [Flavoplaca oasis]|nr:MAG: hypothetical protein LQ337_004291 [Flavoplaca oasis]